MYRFAKEKLYLDARDREVIVAIALDGGCNVIGVSDESVGDLSNAIINPREVLKFLILSNAHSVILLHNHPSGDSTPSQTDIDTTKRLKTAFEIMGIGLLDHIVIGRGGYTSIKDKLS